MDRLNRIIFLGLGFFSFIAMIDKIPKHTRSPANKSAKEILCDQETNECPFLIIGHRGAPYDYPENTIGSFEKAVELGANAMELDLAVTKDDVVVIHDASPHDGIAIARQVGLENFPYVPFVPSVGSPWRRPVRELTVEELRAHYGYSQSSGPIADIFVTGKKIDWAKIPTFEEYANWAGRKSELLVSFLDVKVDELSVDDALYLAQKVDSEAKDAQTVVFYSTPSKSLFKKVRQWFRSKPPNGGIRAPIIDLENDGALEVVKQLGVPGIMTGKTMLRSWNGYLKDLSKVLTYRNQNPQNPLYPVISWTIDQQERMYILKNMGVDGIITNRPGELARLVKRHYQDHYRLFRHLAMCWQDHKGSGQWEFCSSGKEIDPFGTIGEREISDWSCSKKDLGDVVRDVFGCGITRRKKVEFKSRLDNSGRTNIWYSPSSGGNVVVQKTKEEYRQDSVPFVLDFKQLACNDGFLNYDCEYQVYIWYLDKSLNHWVPLMANGEQFDSSFSTISQVPKDASMIKVEIYETDDGKWASRGKSKSVSYLPIQASYQLTARAQDNTFRGRLRLRSFKGEDIEARQQHFEGFHLKFNQKKCYDGVLNSSCEYSVKLEYSYDGRQWLDAKGEIKASDSFEIYARVPKSIDKIRLTINETDDGKLASSGAKATVIMDYIHREWAEIISMDRKTFKGYVILNKIDYEGRRFISPDKDISLKE